MSNRLTRVDLVEVDGSLYYHYSDTGDLVPFELDDAENGVIIDFSESVEIWMGENEVSSEFENFGGFYKNGSVTLFAEQSTDKLSDNVGRVAFVPRGISDLVTHGGFGTVMRGSCEVGNNFGLSVAGIAEWDGGLGIYLKTPSIDTESNALSYVAGKSTSDDHPHSFHYGLRIYLTIPIT